MRVVASPVPPGCPTRSAWLQRRVGARIILCVRLCSREKPRDCERHREACCEELFHNWQGKLDESLARSSQGQDTPSLQFFPCCCAIDQITNLMTPCV